MIKKGATYFNAGLYGACLGGGLNGGRVVGGKRKMAELMVEKGASDWDWAYAGAKNGCNDDIMKWLEAKSLSAKEQKMVDRLTDLS